MAHLPTLGVSHILQPFAAIWDTGASATAISQKVVETCGLAPTGMTMVQTAAGLEPAETYVINIGLPNNVGFAMVQVTKANLGDSNDVLIGMDIISQGDFSITNKDGNTVFSFRIPSSVRIDFVKEHNEGALRARIAGSGKGGFRGSGNRKG